MSSRAGTQGTEEVLIQNSQTQERISRAESQRSRRERGFNSERKNSQKKGRRWKKVESGEGVDSVAGLSLRVKRKKKVESKKRALKAIAILRGYGLLKRRPGDKSFEEERAEYKREELALEEAKYARCVGPHATDSKGAKAS
jgi:hypothetical protein